MTNDNHICHFIPCPICEEKNMNERELRLQQMVQDLIKWDEEGGWVEMATQVLYLIDHPAQPDCVEEKPTKEKIKDIIHDFVPHQYQKEIYLKIEELYDRKS